MNTTTLQPQGPVSPTQPFTVTLEAQQWNMVLASLAETAFRISAPLIEAISQQLHGQSPNPNGQAVMGLPPQQPN